jgi:hypothetical protein
LSFQTFLGGGSCAESIARSVAHDLEVVDLKRLDSWCEQVWNITEKSKLNSSAKFVSLQDFSPADLEYARGIVREDMSYYGHVIAAYERHGGTSVRGSQIIR